MRVLPVPPVVGQLQARLPDGQLDPAQATDCGWACLASALVGISGVDIAPGCLRQAAGLSEWNGTSTARDITRVARGLGLSAEPRIFGTGQLWHALEGLRHHGVYMLVLGGWLDPVVGHWVLAYERASTVVEVMGPYDARRFAYPKRFIAERSYSSQVLLSPLKGR